MRTHCEMHAYKMHAPTDTCPERCIASERCTPARSMWYICESLQTRVPATSWLRRIFPWSRRPIGEDWGGSGARQRPEAREIAKTKEGVERMERVDGKAEGDDGVILAPRALCVRIMT